MAVLIKRYANRKLYNTETSRYITLRGIAELIESGQEVKVVDNETGEDMTAVTLSQILVDTERGGRSVPGNLLSEIFQRGGDAIVERVRRSVDDAKEDIAELRGNLRELLSQRTNPRDWVAFGPADFERMLQRAFERMAQAFDIPRRSELREISERLDRLTRLLEERGAADAEREEPEPRRRAAER